MNNAPFLWTKFFSKKGTLFKDLKSTFWSPKTFVKGSFFPKILALFTVCIQEQFLIKFGLWSRAYINTQSVITWKIVNRLNTSYLTDSYIVFTLKMESVSKNTIFGLKMMGKSGLEKIFLKFLYAGDYFPLLHKSAQNHKFST